MFQISTDKTATFVNANVIVAYPVNVLVLHFRKHFRRFLIYHGYPFEVFFYAAQMINKMLMSN